VDQADDVVTFLRALTRAESKSAAEEWEAAARLWQRVVAANPVEGRFWTRLAEARHHAQDYRGAVAAYEQALDLRDGYPAETIYRMACCHALLGERDEALANLERALELGYRHLDHARTDDDLASLRDDARFRALVGLVETSGLSRDEGWRTDLRFLVREVKRRAYDPFRYVSEERFDAEVSQLDQAISGLTDLQIVLEMNKLLRLLGDGHAGVWPPRVNDEARQALPVQFYLFEEGIFVVAADPAHADVLGAQVLRIGERPVEEVMEAVDPIIHRDNENGQWPKHLMPRYLRALPYLHALGVAPSPREIVLDVRDVDGVARQVALTTDATRPISNPDNNFPYPDGWVYFPETLPGPLPLYLRHIHTSYWFAYLAEERTVYFQFNAVRDAFPESLADFGARLFAFVDDHEVDKLVLDLRWNNGGNTFLELPLLHRLIASKINRRGRLFVIIGRKTFSAAQNGASLMNRHTEAIFVGEPTGSSPTFVGESIEFELPYSGAWANVSDLLWQSTWPMDYRIWIAPTLYTPPTFAAFRANRDPAVEAILACREHLPGW
jgi:tetratricopeptide (TPR) repeat protein